MIFLTMQQEVAAQLGLDNTITTDNTLVERWINIAQEMVLQAYDWPFAMASLPLIIQTVPDYTTGTVTTTADSSTVTFSATIAASKTGQYLRTSSSDDWYEITAHTAGTDTATISPAAISNGSAVTYTIRKMHYATSSSVDRILSIRQTITPYQLKEATITQFHLFDPDPDSTGTPTVYFMLGRNSSKVWQFGLYPIPDSVINLYVEYLPIATDLSDDNDVSIIPAKWHTSVLLSGALWKGADFIGDSRAPRYRDEFILGIEQMKRQNSPSKQNHRVMFPSDISVPTTAINLPDNYQPYEGI